MAVSHRAARDLSRLNPTFPRIANCYGCGLGSRDWEQGRAYWSKLALVIGGCYDLHYDWDSPHWPRAHEKIAANVAHLRQANPTALVLPYVDVAEGPASVGVPDTWWVRNDKGEKTSAWPGMDRTRMSGSCPERRGCATARPSSCSTPGTCRRTASSISTASCQRMS